MFRFTIRDVLWLTVVVALAVGWWTSNRRVTRRLQATTSHAVALRAQLELAKLYGETNEWARRGGGFNYRIDSDPPDWSWIGKPIP